MNPRIDSLKTTFPQPSTSVAPSEPQVKAAKRGQRNATVLLPGDDVEAFVAMRQEMFDLHTPRTGLEARCVEAMADHEWSMERCRRIRSYYQGKLLALVEGRGEEAHCEKDPHRWHHSAMDCSQDERRIGKLQKDELEKLEALQARRRQNLLEAGEREPVMQPSALVLPEPVAVTEPEERLPPITKDVEGAKQTKPTWRDELPPGFDADGVSGWLRPVELPLNLVSSDATPTGYTAVSSA